MLAVKVAWVKMGWVQFGLGFCSVGQSFVLA